MFILVWTGMLSVLISIQYPVQHMLNPSLGAGCVANSLVLMLHPVQIQPPLHTIHNANNKTSDDGLSVDLFTRTGVG